jgi:hypothetical protein
VPEDIPAAQQFWWIAPAISFCALFAIIWFNWGQYRYRAHRQRTAGLNVFLAYDPDETNEVGELRLPANSEVMVQLRIRPTIQYRQIEIVFGCHGKDITRPVPLRVLNRFIKQGVNREQSPKTHSNHYIDKDDHYHIKETVDRSPPHTQALEFVVRTGSAGTYPILFEIVTDSGEAKAAKGLYLTVVDEPVPAAHLAPPPSPQPTGP